MIDQKEYIGRRRRLKQMMEPGSIAILSAAGTKYRNRDVEYLYRPNSDFYYLTGFVEPDSVAVFISKGGDSEFILFCKEKDAKQEMWNGPIVGPKNACESFGADKAYPINKIDEFLPGLIENRDKVYYSMGRNPEFDQRMMDWVNQVRQKSRVGVHSPSEFIVLENLVHEMRLFKSKKEVQSMRKAAKISADAHKRAMRFCKPGLFEYEIDAEIQHQFMSNGCKSSAYPSIVGGGKNACILHYTDNNAVLNSGDLLLIDAGAEYETYAADITRTFPVNGLFTEAQRLIYELVLEAQLAAIEKVKPGNHWDDPHIAAVNVITKGLLKLGILKGTFKALIKNKAYEKYFVHRTGHWLGMDVHDVGDYKIGETWRQLEVGMVLTVEPGLYFSPSKGLAKKWWNIGVRIEDDILVTRKGPDVLSKHVPKTVAEIEAIMAA